MNKPVVAVIMGSKSDLPIVEGAFQVFRDFNVEYTAQIMSAHRTPEDAANFAANAEKNGLKVMICAAGMAAHLGGVIAAHTILPVIGIPVASEPFHGMDALLATVQMPPGVPVATVTAGKAGGKNAALLALEILAVSDEVLAEKLHAFRKEQTENIRKQNAAFQKELNS